MANALTVYAKLEQRVKMGDLDALLARWEFGRNLLDEQGDAGRLPNGRREELSNALGISESEIDNRKQFAAQFDSEAAVKDALKNHGSWYAICQWGLGKRGQAGDEFVADWTEEQERQALYDAGMALVRMAARVLAPESEHHDYLKRVVGDRRELLLGNPTVERMRDAFIVARDRLNWGIAAFDTRLRDRTTALSVDEQGHVLYCEEGEALLTVHLHGDATEKELLAWERLGAHVVMLNPTECLP